MEFFRQEYWSGGVHWKAWCWSWNSNTLATLCQELTHWKRPWCWEGLGAGGEGDDRGWAGWMASPTWWTWVWINSGSWWWTGRPGMLWFMGSQRVGHDWSTELNWTELNWTQPFPSPGDLPNPETEPESPELQVDSLLSEATREAQNMQYLSFCAWLISLSIMPYRCIHVIPNSRISILF